MTSPRSLVSTSIDHSALVLKHNMNERIEFRKAVIQSLKQGLDTFDMAHLRHTHNVTDDVALQASRDVFITQCLKATDDGNVTDAELKGLRRLGSLLQLSLKQQDACLETAKKRAFERAHEEALDDNAITDSEADTLAHLRHTLGLAPMAPEDLGPRPLPPRRRRTETLDEPEPPRQRQRSRRSALQAFADRFLGAGADPAAALIIVVATPVLGVGFFFLQSHYRRYCLQCGSLTVTYGNRERTAFGGYRTTWRCSKCGRTGSVRR